MVRLASEEGWREPWAGEVLALEAASFYPGMRYDADEYARRAAEPGSRFELAWEADRLVGFCLATPDWRDPALLFVDRLAVAREARGRGVASALLARATARPGFRGVTVTYDPRNATPVALEAFYARRGFRATRTTAECVWMERALAPR